MSALPAKFCFGDGVDQPQHIVSKSDFSTDKSRADGLCVYCKECYASRQRVWKIENPEKVRAAKRLYNKTKRERNNVQ